MDLEITLKETITVRPSELQAANIQTIELSGLDRISPAMLYTIFFFKSQLKNDGENPIELERAKRALQRVLVSWYPAAGRFKFNETTGKLEIDCNNKGVTMITAVTQSKLEELGCLHEYKPCYEKLVPKLSQSSDVSENPLVLVQV